MMAGRNIILSSGYKFFNYQQINLLNKSIDIQNNYYSIRNGHYKPRPWPNNWLPFQWKRPERPPGYFNTPDKIERFLPKNREDLIGIYAEADEIKDAPEDVKKLFRAENLKRRDFVHEKITEIAEKFKRHPFDNCSPEYLVAFYTIKIRARQDLCKNLAPNDAVNKIRLNNFIGKRKMLLNFLYYNDRERYEIVVNALDIVHTPSPAGITDTPRVERKKELRRITSEYCENIRKQKLNAYHEKLKLEQIQFEKEKEETQKWIDDTLIKYNIDDETINKMRKL